LLLFGLDPDFPLVLGAFRRGGEPGDWSRPGVRVGRIPVLGSWEKARGRLWIGLGRRGIAGACWGSLPSREILLPGLEAESLSEGIEACSEALAGGDLSPTTGVVLASREGAWACRAGEEGRTLDRGAAFFPAWDGKGEAFLLEGLDFPGAALRWMEEKGGTSSGSPAVAAALVALKSGSDPSGKFLFAPGTPGAREFLDYSNLLRRLYGPE